MGVGAKRGRLPPEVNRILHVRNLPRKVTAEELYDVFGKYGPIRQIRVGTAPDGDAGKGGAAKGADLRGTAFVVYEDIYDAKAAADHLSGFNVANRYLIVLYYQPARQAKKIDQKKQEEELASLQRRHEGRQDIP